jgi:hypothetical protein
MSFSLPRKELERYLQFQGGYENRLAVNYGLLAVTESPGVKFHPGELEFYIGDEFPFPGEPY